MTVVVLVVVSSSLSESLLGAINTRSVLPVGEAYSEIQLQTSIFSDYSPIIPDYSPIILALCSMLIHAYYSQNYAGIIRPTLIRVQHFTHVTLDVRSAE